MRFAMVWVLIAATPALAEPYRLVEDAALGATLDHPVLGGVDEALTACTKDGATGSALFWLEFGKAGKVSTAHVHGAGKLDACLERALAKGAAAAPLANAVILVGHLDLMEHDSSKLLPSPRMSTAAVIVDAHEAKWQLTATRIAYTANRMLDITKSLDDASRTIAACAGKRREAARALAWMAGRAIVRSGTPAYDDCVAKALSAIKLPAPESAFWMELEIGPPTEALAARSDKASLSHPQAVRDAVTTAVRSRKLELQGCLDGHKGATLVALAVKLVGTKANVKAVATGDAAADACVKQTFHDVAIPAATASDKLDVQISLDPE